MELTEQRRSMILSSEELTASLGWTIMEQMDQFCTCLVETLLVLMEDSRRMF